MEGHFFGAVLVICGYTSFIVSSSLYLRSIIDKILAFLHSFRQQKLFYNFRLENFTQHSPVTIGLCPDLSTERTELLCVTMLRGTDHSWICGGRTEC